MEGDHMTSPQQEPVGRSLTHLILALEDLMDFLDLYTCFIFFQTLPCPNFPLLLFTETTQILNSMLGSVNSPGESTNLHTVPLGFRIVQHRITA